MAAPTGFWDSGTATKREFTQALMNSTLMQNNTKSNLDLIDQLDGMVGYETDGNRLFRSNGTAFSALEMVDSGVDSAKPAGSAANNGKLFFATDTLTLYGVFGNSRYIMSASDKVVTKTDGNDTVNNSTTNVLVSGLAFPLVANISYQLQIWLYWSTNYNADIQFDLRTPSLAVGRAQFDALSASGGTTYTHRNIRIESGQATSNAASLGGDSQSIVMHVNLTNGNAAGDLQVGFAQFAAHASNTVVYAESGVTVNSTRIIGHQIP